MTPKLFLSTENVYHFCVKERFYTCGSCSDYDSMFNMVELMNAAETLDMFYEFLEKIARDIYIHSNPNIARTCHIDDDILDINISNIMSYLQDYVQLLNKDLM